VSSAIAEKLVELGAIPLTFSDSSGFVYEPNGFDAAKVKTVRK
jgi:glutamate dehydrogenase (NADP+)